MKFGEPKEKHFAPKIWLLSLMRETSPSDDKQEELDDQNMSPSNIIFT